MRGAEGESRPLGDQESIGCDGQRDVVMEAAPSASFVVREANLLFEFLIVALNAPAQLGNVYQALETDVRRQCREPVFGRRSAGALAIQPIIAHVHGLADIEHAIKTLAPDRW